MTSTVLVCFHELTSLGRHFGIAAILFYECVSAQQVGFLRVFTVEMPVALLIVVFGTSSAGTTVTGTVTGTVIVTVGLLRKFFLRFFRVSPFHATILEPNFDLCVSESKSGRQLTPVRLRDVLLYLKPLFESLALEVRKHGPRPRPFPFRSGRAAAGNRAGSVEVVMVMVADSGSRKRTVHVLTTAGHLRRMLMVM